LEETERKAASDAPRLAELEGKREKRNSGEDRSSSHRYPSKKKESKERVEARSRL